MMKRRLVFLFLMVGTIFASGQNQAFISLNEKIDSEQARIDRLDGKEDREVTLKTEIQTERATLTFLLKGNEIQDNIGLSNDDIPIKLKKLRLLFEMLSEVSEKNVNFYLPLKNDFDLILKVQTEMAENKILPILTANSLSAMNIIPFYSDKAYAFRFLTEMGKLKPDLILPKTGYFQYEPFADKVIAAAGRSYPSGIVNYLSGQNPVNRLVQQSNDPVLKEILGIFSDFGVLSKAHFLMEDIYSGRITRKKAHELSADKIKLFKRLIELKKRPEVIGENSIDKELGYLSLETVRKVNEMHHESDENKRFAPVSEFSSEEIYTLMVYTEDEIFTSTFLGFFKRMNERNQLVSNFLFLEKLNFTRFRVFIKQCAGFNTLTTFLTKMKPEEKDELFRKLVEGLEKNNGDPEQLVAVADIFGSISDTKTLEMFKKLIVEKYDVQIIINNELGIKIYGLLMEVLGILESAPESGSSAVLKNKDLTKDGSCIQQHFFYDDEDGIASYNSFISLFNRPGWKTEYFKNHIKISSTQGKKIWMYANKPKNEFDGQDEIKAVFEKKGRWPDIVVHRGHSFYAQTAIESLTPNVELIFLGSCGGYNNVSKVLTYSPDAQIISSKQVGTLSINNKILWEINEGIRLGKDLDWKKIWQGIEKTMVNGSREKGMFNDYISPDKNLGAIIIKRYREIL